MKKEMSIVMSFAIMFILMGAGCGGEETQNNGSSESNGTSTASQEQKKEPELPYFEQKMKNVKEADFTAEGYVLQTPFEEDKEDIIKVSFKAKEQKSEIEFDQFWVTMQTCEKGNFCEAYLKSMDTFKNYFDKSRLTYTEKLTVGGIPDVYIGIEKSGDIAKSLYAIFTMPERVYIVRFYEWLQKEPGTYTDEEMKAKSIKLLERLFQQL